MALDAKFFKEHRTVIIMFVVVLVITGAVFAIFAPNSTLFQGSLSFKMKQLAVQEATTGSIVEDNLAELTPEIATETTELPNLIDVINEEPEVVTNLPVIPNQRFNLSEVTLENRTATPLPDQTEETSESRSLLGAKIVGSQENDGDPEEPPEESEESPPAAPEPAVATNVDIAGEPCVGEELLGLYELVPAPAADQEENSEYVWLKADDTDQFSIVIQQGQTYQVAVEDIGDVLAFQVTPKEGDAVVSEPFGPIVNCEEPEPTPEPEKDPVDPEPTPESENQTVEIIESETPETLEVVPDPENELFIDDTQPEVATVVEPETPVNTLPSALPETNGSLTSNTNASVLGSAGIQGSTGIPAAAIPILMGGAAAISHRLRRK